MRKPDPDVTALRTRRRLTARKILPLRGANNFSLAAGIIAAVVLHLLASARFQRFEIGHLFRRNQIAAAQLRAIELQRLRQAIQHAFHRKGRLRIAGAAHRRDRRFVSMHSGNVDRQGRDDIRAGQSGR